MASALLSDRTVIAISGEDRIAFLQGLITNDAVLLGKGKALYAALLSPQGKFLHDFFLVPQGERILLDVNRDRAPDLLARFNIYKLRAKTAFETLPDMQVTAAWVDASEGITDPRLPALGKRIYGTAKADTTLEAYEAHRIALGIPDGAKDMTIDKSLLLEFHFESLHGVSFSKGCYVGQEVTARSKFRGQVRKQLYAIEGASALPAPGTKITAADKELGELKSVSGKHGLAILRAEELEKLTAPLTAGDVPLQYHLPEWVQTSA